MRGARSSEARPQLRLFEQGLDRPPQVAGIHEESRHAVLDRVDEPADAGGHDRAPYAIASRATTP